MSKNKVVIWIVEIICLILFIYSTIQVIKWYKNSKDNKKIITELSSDVKVEEDEEEKYSINFNKLKEKNKDTVAWIKVENTNIEFPVVQSVDNSYYLTHDFNNKYSVAGWIFADYRNKFDGTDKNIVLYGHNMHDNSMFSTLKNVLKKKWYENYKNYIITFITEDEYQKYQVFSVYQIEAEDYYIKTDFKDNEFSEFVNIVTKRSIKKFDVNVTNEDKILTLSTCANNDKYRVVLHGVRI